MPNKYDSLKLENQLCFPLYAASRAIIRRYKPFLDELELTYTQYVVMLVLWEKQSITLKAMGDILYLDSGTLTPLLKKLEAKNLLTRTRAEDDERNLIVEVAPGGEELRERALKVPQQIRACSTLTDEEASLLHRLLDQVIDDAENH